MSEFILIKNNIFKYIEIELLVEKLSISGLSKNEILKEVKNKNISSGKLRGSVSKALEYIAFLLVGVIAVYLFNSEYAVNLIAISLCGVEFTSICENAKETGFKFPDKIIALFRKGDGGE